MFDLKDFSDDVLREMYDYVHLKLFPQQHQQQHAIPIASTLNFTMPSFPPPTTTAMEKTCSASSETGHSSMLSTMIEGDTLFVPSIQHTISHHSSTPMKTIQRRKATSGSRSNKILGSASVAKQEEHCHSSSTSMPITNITSLATMNKDATTPNTNKMIPHHTSDYCHPAEQKKMTIKIKIYKVEKSPDGRWYLTNTIVVFYF